MDWRTGGQAGQAGQAGREDEQTQKRIQQNNHNLGTHLNHRRQRGVRIHHHLVLLRSLRLGLLLRILPLRKPRKDIAFVRLLLVVGPLLVRVGVDLEYEGGLVFFEAREKENEHQKE